jgi:hypothetical protein
MEITFAYASDKSICTAYTNRLLYALASLIKENYMINILKEKKANAFEQIKILRVRINMVLRQMQALGV